MSDLDKICSPFQEEHIVKITNNEARSKSNTHQITEIRSMLEVMHSMNTNIEVMAKEMVHQGKTMDRIMEAQVETQSEVDDIKEKMETKDTVSRLHERIDYLEKVGGKIAIKAWAYAGSIVSALAVGYIIARLT